ncbi:hypothetical protein EDD17DRAFT_1776980 [Pisolithus thermaeus]|nr:hypothetical protein EDD17DRAFT_1776980 [Pisolithus thermaeus]
MSHAGSPYELSSKPESEESLVSQDRESTACPQELSETQLRRLYDDEEAERLMHLISAVGTPLPLATTFEASYNLSIPMTVTHNSPRPRYTDHDSSSKPAPAPLPPLPRDRSITEYIAHDLILPYLPLDGSTPPPFTIKRFRLTTQRLYLAIIPTYQPLLLDLTSLALWKDKQRSLLYCACFWILWYHDGLLAAFLCRIIWCLLRRRFLPYPSLAEYQEKRQNATRARRFGDEVQRRLSVSTLGPDKPDQTNGGSASAPEADGENTVLEGAEDSEEIQNLKRDLLHLLDIVADLHERVNNILMWRRPAVTRRYCILLSVVAFCVITLPSQYIAKITYMFLGIVYWHLLPNPALLSDAPTDVEYAVELIGQRVASGQELLPRNKDRDRLANPDNSKPDLTLIESSSSDRTEEIGGVNWKKWGARIAQGKSLLEENKSISSLGGVSFPIRLCSKNCPIKGGGHPRQSRYTLSLAFPAQHSSAPGLISLTSTTMCFTSLTSKHAKLVVPFSQLRGVKKTGLTKGLAITWVATDQDAQGAVKEEKFHWVGDRDELFARLLACDGGRWIRL